MLQFVFGLPFWQWPVPSMPSSTVENAAPGAAEAAGDVTAIAASVATLRRAAVDVVAIRRARILGPPAWRTGSAEVSRLDLSRNLRNRFIPDLPISPVTSLMTTQWTGRVRTVLPVAA